LRARSGATACPRYAFAPSGISVSLAAGPAGIDRVVGGVVVLVVAGTRGHADHHNARDRCHRGAHTPAASIDHLRRPRNLVWRGYSRFARS
jgi:hypothetical protein